MYIALSSSHSLMNIKCAKKSKSNQIDSKKVWGLFSDVWSENAALFKKLMKIHSNPPILYYGFVVIYRVAQKECNDFDRLISRTSSRKRNCFFW